MPRFTIIKEGADLSLLKNLVVLPSDKDPVNIKSNIEFELIRLGFNVTKKGLNMPIPEIVVQFNYIHTYTRGKFGRAFWYVDNFTITFTDIDSGDILLTSRYPKFFWQTHSSLALKILFDDIQKAMDVRTIKESIRLPEAKTTL
jgi:hypothetical protein